MVDHFLVEPLEESERGQKLLRFSVIFLDTVCYLCKVGQMHSFKYLFMMKDIL